MSAPPHRPAHNRPALIALVIVAALGCLALSWWQWQRFESSSGTGQNLGYALQWPLFAAFAVFAYFRFVRLERESEDNDRAEHNTAKPERSAKTVALREIPEGLLPERPKAVRHDDPVLAEYNSYLAQLHANDLDEQIRTAGLPARHTERSAG
ncbi:transcriptional regulator [Nocardia australiensis]|uniref:transcriptional regulator n=1 Tax=Nocardia australiensis TaxID=2887191 RepID=UPI001D14D6ED|nr:transcriptional regulator [Nocardia australiensis]